MPMLVQCPNPACKASCSVADSRSGGQFKCPKCAQPFAVKPTHDGEKGDTKQGQPSSSTNPFPVLPAEFGRYRILQLLGKGGMGAVYLAHDSQLGRQVALKVPFFDAAEAPQRVERFVREARSAAVLHHPNICTVFDAGQIDGRPFITMAYLDGTPLAKEIDGDVPLAQVRVAEIVRKIALALEHAHSKGIVHRDLKPANVMLAAGDEPVVMDFGLAKRVVDVDPNEAKLTRLGGILGTPSYMSPEQVKGDSAAIGPTTDVYALGVILFEMLTGRTPYTGPANHIVMGQILAAPVPPVNEFRADVDSRLDAICRKALAKNPAERFPNMAAFANVLGFYLKAPAAAPPAPPALPAPPVAAAFTAPAPVVDPSPFAYLVGTSPTAPATTMTRKEPSRPAGQAAPKRWLLAGVALGVALLTLLLAIGFVGLWASGAFKVKTKDGVIVLENLPPDADVTVDGETVTVQSADGKTFEVRVDASKKKHQIEVKKGGVKVFGDEVEVDAGGRKAVLVRLEPKEKPAEGGATKVPAEKDLPKTVTVDLGGGVKMDFVLIPRGTFKMGSPEGEKDRNSDEQQHDVELTRPYYLAKYSVTQEQYQRIIGKNPSFFSATGDGSGKVTGLNTKQFPVENVSWDDAKACCSNLTNKDKQGRRFRLPTEAEWQYACRAGTQNTFFFGDDSQRLGDYAWYNENSNGRPHPVGEKKPNAWGLYDMAGNVWQWCEDYYGPYEGLNAKDPLRFTQSSDNRVVLGGSWANNATQHLRDARRHKLPPSRCADDVGFRMAFDPLVLSDEATEEFHPLFNSKDLTGWKTHPKQPGNWRVEKGVLTGSGNGISHLYTERGDYSNFHLRLEVRVNQRGNTGVYFRAPYGPTMAQNGSQPESPANPLAWVSGYNAKIDASRHGGLLIDVIPELHRTREPVFRPGEWITLEIIAEGNHVVIKIDGQTTSDFTDEQKLYTKGHLVLQQHGAGTVAEFRNIEIKETPPIPEAMRPPAPVQPIPQGEPLSPDALVTRPAKIEGVQSWTVDLSARLKALPEDIYLEREVSWSKDFLFTRVAHSDSKKATYYNWDTASGKVIQSAVDETRSAPSPDSKWWAVERNDNDVDLLDSSRKRIRTLKGNTELIGRFCWSADSKRLAVRGLTTGKIVVWDVEQEKPLSIMEAEESNGYVRMSLTLSPDGKTAVFASTTEGLQRADCDTGKITTLKTGLPEEVNKRCGCVAWSPDGKTLAADGGGGGDIWVWPADGSGPARKLISNWGHVAWSLDSKTLAIGNHKGILLVSVETGQFTALLLSIDNEGSLALNSEGTFITTPAALGKELLYVVQTAKGRETLTADKMLQKYAWKNDPNRVRLSDK